MTQNSRAAVLWEAPSDWDIVDVTLDDPQPHEVLVRFEAAGLCHSDDHIAKADMPVGYMPLAGGHEGAGVVEAVGSAVQSVEVGDHIVSAFIPPCGSCRWCASGMQNLCDNGAFMMTGTQLDGTFRMHADGTDIGQCSLVSTFSEYSILPERACVRIPKDIPLTSACLIGCSVATGWGSAVNGAGVRPGDVVIIVGIGGIGINAVQGAKHAGASRIIAVDPVAFKRDTALKFGATDALESIIEATDLAQSLTNGQGADSAIVTIGVVSPQHIADAFASIRKAGTVAVTSVANIDAEALPINLAELTLFQKRIQGTLFGMMNPTRDIPFFIDMYRSGQVKIDELVTARYTLDEINKGYQDLHAGVNIRGVIDYAKS